LKSGPPKSPRPKSKFDNEHTDENAYSSIILRPIELILCQCNSQIIVHLQKYKTAPLTLAISIDIVEHTFHTPGCFLVFRFRPSFPPPVTIKT
jgi:hypothetical protein